MNEKVDPALYEDDSRAGNEEFVKLAQLCGELHETQREIARLEEALASAKAHEVNIAEHLLPEQMDAMGTDDWRDARTGKRFVINNITRAAIPRKHKDAALKWLDDHGYSALQKRQVSVAFNKEQEAEAADLAKALRENNFDVKMDSSVHSSTLSAWVRQRLEEGAEIPMELFGVHVVRRVKIK